MVVAASTCTRAGMLVAPRCAEIVSAEASPLSQAADVAYTSIALRKGASLVKYCRRGKPHACHVQLSPDECEVQYVSASSKPRTVRLVSVKDVVAGQTTVVFKCVAPRGTACACSPARILMQCTTPLGPNQASAWSAQGEPVILHFVHRAGRQRTFAGPRVQGALSVLCS